MFTSLLRILVILGVAAGAGYIRARIGDLPWVPDVKVYQAEQQKRKEIRATAGVTLEEFLDLIQQGAIVIDARPAEEFEKGHLETGGYPPVLNVPPETAHEQLERLMQLEGYPIVLYCTSVTCEFAEELLMEFEQYGLFYDMKIFFPGWEGIQAAGLETTTGPDTWTGFDQEPNTPAEGEYEAGDDQNGPEPDTPVEIEP